MFKQSYLPLMDHPISLPSRLQFHHSIISENKPPPHQKKNLTHTKHRTPKMTLCQALHTQLSVSMSYSHIFSKYKAIGPITSASSSLPCWPFSLARFLIQTQGWSWSQQQKNHLRCPSPPSGFNGRVNYTCSCATSTFTKNLRYSLFIQLQSK